MGFAATAFGLDLRAAEALPCLAGGESGPPTGRRVELALAEEVDRLDAVELIAEEREPDGSVSFQIEGGGDAGYRIRGARYGVNAIAADGSTVRGAPGSGGMEAWQRLLVAQVLPFVSVLRGLEVFHASAVAYGDRGVALVAPGGSGKTSLALALTERGAGFLADDVLAVERREGRLLAHPGAPVAWVDHDGEETARPMPTPGEPVPLRSVFLLERRADGPAEPVFEPPADARELLASTFNLVLNDPHRLERLLDTCALAARACTIERVRFGLGVGVSELAAALDRRIGGQR